MVDKFYSYYNTDYPFLTKAIESLEQKYSPEELALCERILADLTKELK